MEVTCEPQLAVDLAHIQTAIGRQESFGLVRQSANQAIDISSCYLFDITRLSQSDLDLRLSLERHNARVGPFSDSAEVSILGS